MGILSYFVANKSNRSILLRAIRKQASQQSPFELKLANAFLGRKADAKVSLSVKSEAYIGLRSRLESDVGNTLVYNGSRFIRKQGDPILVRYHDEPHKVDSRPWILIMSDRGLGIANQVVDRINQDHPEGIGLMTAVGLDFVERDSSGLSGQLVASFPFLGEPIDDVE